jgi:alanine racemase
MRPAWAEVDLDALIANLAQLRERVKPAGVLAVLKADAYGHGAPAAARALEAAGIDYAGVALLEEGAELRREGVGLPILVLGAAQESQLPLYRSYRLTPTISSLDQLDLWQAFARGAGGEGAPIDVHLKIDTGMRRLGVPLLRAIRAPGAR